MENLSHISDYLDTYAGRDKALRTLSYAAKFLTVIASSKNTEKKLNIFSSQLSEGRMILRMLDDVPTLHYVITYGWGETEPDKFIRWLQLVQNIVDTVYCGIEHIYWAGLHNIASINIDKWDLATTWFWIISLHLSFMKSMERIKKIQEYKHHIEPNLKKNYCNQQCKTTLKDLRKKCNTELLTCVRLLLDISFATSYLPPGILWGGRLKTWHVGALGTLSSLIGFYQALGK